MNLPAEEDTGAPSCGASAAKKKEPPAYSARGLMFNFRQRPTLPHSHPCSTIGAGELNFRVRDGNGWVLSAKVTEKLYFYLQLNQGCRKTEQYINYGQAARPISISKLNTLLCLHI